MFEVSGSIKNKDYEIYLKVRDRYMVTKAGEVYSLYFANRHVNRKRETPYLLKAVKANGPMTELHWITQTAIVVMGGLCLALLVLKM